MKLVGHRCTRWFFRDVKFSSPCRESTGVQNRANIFGKSRWTFLKYKTMKWEIKRTHLSSKRSMKNDYFDTQIMSIILCMSFCIVLFAYFLSMLITAILLSRSCPIVDLKNVLMRRRALKDLWAEHEVAQYWHDLLRDFVKDILQSTRLHTHALKNCHKSTWPPTHMQFQSQHGLDYHSQSLGRTQCSNSE